MGGWKTLIVPGAWGGVRSQKPVCFSEVINTLEIQSEHALDCRSIEIKEQNQIFALSNAKNIQSIIEINQQIFQRQKDIFSKQCRSLVLSGDHSYAPATLSALAEVSGPGDIGVIWIDAHADLHTPWTTPSGNVHGMGVAASLGLGVESERWGQENGRLISAWERYSNLGWKFPILKPQNLVYLGLRDFEPEEMTMIQELGVRHYSAVEVRKKGLSRILKVIQSQLARCSKLFVSFDVDALDSQFMPATGLPISGGLFPVEVSQILKFFVADPRFAGLEVSEFNSEMDQQGKGLSSLLVALDPVLEDMKQESSSRQPANQFEPQSFRSFAIEL